MTAIRRAQDRVHGRAEGLLLLGLVLAYFVILAPYGLELADEGHLVHQIYRSFLGQLPYLDFHTGYTPGVYYWNAGLFAAFGVNLIVVRLSLAICNALAIWLLYVVARRLGASAGAAASAAVLYLGLIPFHDGHFAPFNIPYPAWYVTPLWMLSIICVLGWWRNGTVLRWGLAGLCAGVVFAFKQNSGLLNLAALAITAGLLMRPDADVTPRGNGVTRLLLRAERIIRWLLPLAGALGLLVIMGRAAGSREAWLFAVPLLVVVLWQLLVPKAGVARTVRPLQLWSVFLLLLVGFAMVTVPWAAYFWLRMGTKPFLRAILYIGASYEDFYFIGYPRLGWWSIAVAAGIGLLVLAGLVLRKLRPPLRCVGGVAGAGAIFAAIYLVRHPPPMVEGFQASVVMRVQDVSFALILCIEWAAIALHMVTTARRQHGVEPPDQTALTSASSARRDRSAQFLIVLVSAILMHAQLYPRSDFMHLVYAAPGVLILGASLVHRLSALWASGLAEAPASGRMIQAAFLVPVYALALILLTPALERIEYLVRSGLEQDPSAVVSLDTPRAPFVLEPAAGRLFLAMSSTLRYVDAHSRPDDFVFTFPCLDFISFLADRRDPTRHGYYYPGSPGHAVEAEVIDSLRDRPPRFIVALHDHALFFVSAPLYYFNLRRYVTEHYRFDRRIGMFDVLRPREASDDIRDGSGQEAAADLQANDTQVASDDASMPHHELAETIDLWERELHHQVGQQARRISAVLAAMPHRDITGLAELLLRLDAPGQRTIALLVRKSRSTEGAAALAARLGDSWLDPTVRELFIRVIAEVGDLQSIVPLLHAVEGADLGTLEGVGGDLFTIALRSWLSNYWYAPPQRAELRAIEEALPDRQLIAWIDNPWEIPPLRAFAVRIAAGRTGRQFVPFLVRLLADNNENWQLRADAAQTLVESGFGAQVFPALGSLMQHGEPVPPMLLAALYQQAPDVGYEVLTVSMAAVDDMARAEAFWVAGALHDTRMADPLRAGLSDPAREVRMAAAWGLGNSGDPSVLGDLQRLARDGDDEVEQFAERAIQHVLYGAANQRPD